MLIILVCNLMQQGKTRSEGQRGREKGRGYPAIKEIKK